MKFSARTLFYVLLMAHTSLLFSLAGSADVESCRLPSEKQPQPPPPYVTKPSTWLPNIPSVNDAAITPLK
jgi:hypothetical protein